MFIWSMTHIQKLQFKPKKYVFHVLMESDKISAYMLILDSLFCPIFHICVLQMHMKEKSSLWWTHMTYLLFFRMNIFCKMSSVLFLWACDMIKYYHKKCQNQWHLTSNLFAVYIDLPYQAQIFNNIYNQ